MTVVLQDKKIGRTIYDALQECVNVESEYVEEENKEMC